MQNLVGIAEVVLIVQNFEYFQRLARDRQKEFGMVRPSQCLRKTNINVKSGCLYLETQAIINTSTINTLT